MNGIHDNSKITSYNISDFWRERERTELKKCGLISAIFFFWFFVFFCVCAIVSCFPMNLTYSISTPLLYHAYLFNIVKTSQTVCVASVINAFIKVCLFHYLPKSIQPSCISVAVRLSVSAVHIIFPLFFFYFHSFCFFSHSSFQWNEMKHYLKSVENDNNNNNKNKTKRKK